MRFRRPRASVAKKAGMAAVAARGAGRLWRDQEHDPPTAGHRQRGDGRACRTPNAFYIGLYEAEALGYFKQTDMNVHVVVPGAGQDPVTMVHDRQALVGISSRPNVLLNRNVDEPVVGVAALVHAPLSAITIPVPKAGPSGGAALTTTRPRRPHGHARGGPEGPGRTRPRPRPPRRPRPRPPRRRPRPPRRPSPSPTRRCGPNSCSSC